MSDGTINERLRECSLPQSSFSEVFASDDHQGECLDKTIVQLRDRETSVRVQTAALQLASSVGVESVVMLIQ